MSKRMAITIVAVLLSFSFVVLADSPARPTSYKEFSPDQKYVFVMIAPTSPEVDAGRWIESKASEIRSIRTHYQKSGMYLNDGSDSPLWTVDWYAFGVVPLSDGVHLVRHGPWADSSDDLAVAFYARGVLLREYAIRDLVAVPSLMPHSVSHFTWLADSQLDDSAKTFTVKTKHGESYVFDVTSGRIDSAYRPIHWRIRAVVILLIGVAGIAFWLWKKKRARV